MHVLVTGAGGFVGRALVRRLLRPTTAGPNALSMLTLIDHQLPPIDGSSPGVMVRSLEGDFGDAATWERALSPAPQCVYHLASVPGSLAEAQPALGSKVNLLAPIAFFERLARLDSRPRVVFASSVAVYGAMPTGGRMDEQAPTRPVLSYGAHKRMTEVLLADLSRRGELDAVSLRLPGIVARPLSPTGHGSAFMSDLIRRLCAGEAYECPVSAAARAWWMSLPCCVDNLVHAGRFDTAALAADRTVQLPVLSARVDELVASIDASNATRGMPRARIEYRPDERTEAWFGRMPPLDTPHARRLGFHDDGDLTSLLRNAFATPADDCQFDSAGRLWLPKPKVPAC